MNIISDSSPNTNSSWCSAVASFLKRHHININAKPNERFHIHRSKGDSGNGSSNNKPPFWMYIVGGIIGLIVIGAVVQWLLQLLATIVPWLAVGVVCFVIGKVFLASKRR